MRNRVLEALSPSEYARLESGLRPVDLDRGTVLYGQNADCAYFINSGLVSLVASTESGNSIEVGMMGNEGVLGIPLMLGSNQIASRAVVVVSGDGMRVSVELLKAEFRRKSQLHDLLLRFWCLLQAQISQSVLCNRFHPIESRLCRWLLMARDRVECEEIHVTQEFLAQMVGATRSVVTLAAGELQRKGLIRYNRGRITVSDVPRLESSSCECYRILKTEYCKAIRRQSPQFPDSG